MASGDNQEDKKTFNGGFGLFLLAALLSVIWVQSFFEAKLADVAFSYQLEHLVNLDLIEPAESTKTAGNGTLVSFNGRYVDQLTDASRQRYHYLELIAQDNQARVQNDQLQQEQSTYRKEALQAVSLYTQLRGLSLPETGLVIYLDSMKEGSKLLPDNSWLVLKRQIPLKVVSFDSLMQNWGKMKAAGQEPLFIEEMTDWIGLLASAKLGIATDSLKQVVRSDLSALEALKPSQDRQLIAAAIEKVAASLPPLFQEIEKIDGDWRFTALRSVRSCRASTLKLAVVQERLEQLQGQLDKQLTLVKNLVWYFNGKELSSESLAKQDAEEFGRWFERSKVEWERFSANAGLRFQAGDQPSNLVLERTFKSEQAPTNYLGLLFTMMPVLLVAGLIYFMFARQVKGAGGMGAMTFGKSPAKLLQKGTHKITFKDVAGIDEAKEELQEIVDFLREPKKFTELGAQIPKGVLCVGSPGTGKTLIARAVAGEADRPFFSISGSDFVEMFVGVGASRIRDMFKEAKKHAPCIIFMDEIDAVGRQRGVGMGGGHDEREQTLNQLLVEMDGFEANEGIILMAATNRPDVLDKALLRPGRFDRRVTIDLPDIKGRYEILKLHARKIKMGDAVDLMKVARGTPGSSGADLKNILNEAALHAVRQGHKLVLGEDVDYATDKVRFGKERRSLEMSKDEVRRTAYHEAGHAVVGFVSPHCDPVEKVTVIPRGMSLGATYTLPKGNRLGYWKLELSDIMAMIMGGRAAEEVFLGDLSSGAQSDIQRVTHLARSMICEWGMSDSLGQIAYEERSEAGAYLGMAQSNSKPYSEQTALMIDQEIRALIKQAHDRAIEIMNEKKEQVELMAQMLVEFETLDDQDVKDIMALKFDRVAREKRLRQELSQGEAPTTDLNETGKDGDLLKEESTPPEATSSQDPSLEDSSPKESISEDLSQDPSSEDSSGEDKTDPDSQL